MPFLRLSKKQPPSTPKYDRPLLYATQSPSTPSIAQSTTTTASHAPHQQETHHDTSPLSRKHQQPYHDITSTAHTEQQRQQPYHDTTMPTQPSDPPQNSQEEANEEPQPSTSDPPFTRPKTPPQGSNHNPWSSYRDLPPDHPVFRYPDEMREKMYAKGVDPVVKAEMDLARLGKVYGESHHAKGFWKRGTSMMGQFGTMATGGAF